MRASLVSVGPHINAECRRHVKNSASDGAFHVKKGRYIHNVREGGAEWGEGMFTERQVPHVKNARHCLSRQDATWIRTRLRDCRSRDAQYGLGIGNRPGRPRYAFRSVGRN